MTPEQQDLLEKAKRKLASAKLSFQGGYPEDAVSRAYYSIFYVAKALLLEEKLQLGTSHSSIISAFGRDLANTGKVPRELHRKLIDAQDLRIQGDYGPSNAVTSEQAQEQLLRAEEFLNLAQERIVQPT